MDGKTQIIEYLTNVNDNILTEYDEDNIFGIGSSQNNLLYPLNVNDCFENMYHTDEGFYFQCDKDDTYNIFMLSGVVSGSSSSTHYRMSKFHSIMNSFTYLRENATLTPMNYSTGVYTDMEEFPARENELFPVTQIIIQPDDLNGFDRLYTFKVKGVDGFFYYNFRSSTDMLSKVKDGGISFIYDLGLSKLKKGNTDLLVSNFKMIDLNNPILMGSNYIISDLDEGFPEDKPREPEDETTSSSLPPKVETKPDRSWIWYLISSILIVLSIIVFYLIKRYVF